MQEKRTRSLAMHIVVGLALVTALGACGGGDKNPIGPPLPEPEPVLCPITIVAEPVAGFPGIYTVKVTPDGPYDLTINNVTSQVERGQLVFATTGDSVQGCRPCGCSRSVGVR